MKAIQRAMTKYPTATTSSLSQNCMATSLFSKFMDFIQQLQSAFTCWDFHGEAGFYTQYPSIHPPTVQLSARAVRRKKKKTARRYLRRLTDVYFWRECIFNMYILYTLKVHQITSPLHRKSPSASVETPNWFGWVQSRSFLHLPAWKEKESSLKTIFSAPTVDYLSAIALQENSPCSISSTARHSRWKQTHSSFLLCWECLQILKQYMRVLVWVHWLCAFNGFRARESVRTL